ncbi:phage head-tail connector protein [Methylocella sp.]|uniref:phage head-tail connector protein n=1 Tax=Methylocella sp. TaxID=1978226 RepID=UPI0037844CEA
MAISYDLAHLDDVKAWLDVSGDADDALLGRLVGAVSRAILSYLGRSSILPSAHVEQFLGGGETALTLARWPVAAILACSIDGAPLSPDDFALEPADEAPPGRPQRLSLKAGRFPCGARIEATYRAGYEVSGEAATAPAQAPFSVTAAAPYGAWACDGGARLADGALLRRVAEDPGAGEYAVDGGVYQFSAAEAGAAVELSYGYVPADVALCCMDWTAERYAYRGRIGQSSKSLGGQETIAFIVADMPDFVRGALQPYRRITP